MKLKHDGSVDIAVGLSARSKLWKNQQWLWSELVKKLTKPYKTSETYKQFKGAAKSEQSKIKDVGGYVGGYLNGGRRKPGNVVHRQLATLDIDFAHKDFWSDFCMQFDNAAVLHATHSHSPGAPRYRLILPLSRACSGDEYVALARSLAGSLGIDLFDNTTFEINRLMFWPSSPSDVEYYSEFQDGPWVDVDEILKGYKDWTDSSSWPISSRVTKDLKNRCKQQADPDEKAGIIGAFCRAYSIPDAIESFLDDVYEPAIDGRYTYTKGTTAAGLVVYEDKYAYSHHGTDPCSGRLCNAFDLVRIHKFGHLDPAGTSDAKKGKSFKAMQKLAAKDKAVKKTIASETFENAKYDFAEPLEPGQDDEPEDYDWAAELEVDGRGKYLSSATNLNILFANDPRLKGIFRENSFDGKRYIFKSVPWRVVDSPEPMRNVDYSGVRNYIETIYGISGNLKIDDALALEFEKYSFHPIRDYLSALEWDKQKRVDTLLIDYLGAEDTIYTRQAIRKMLVGAVARVFRPGIKFDLVLTLVGDQGTGKSTFVNKLGRQWFSDTFMTVHGKEALEQIQGAWLIEIAELAGLRKAEVEAIKHFISKQEDMFRPAYARAAETFKRQCVFFGTTNNSDFLRDPSGNRRFLPVDIDNRRASKDIFTEFDAIVDQVWAEAVALYKAGEKLFMSKDAEALAYKEQTTHTQSDHRRGIIIEYLDTLLPEDWESKDIFARRSFLHDELAEKGTEERIHVCVAEIWAECLGKSAQDMTRYNTRDLNDIMRSLDDWEDAGAKRFPLYGVQRSFARKLD